MSLEPHQALGLEVAAAENGLKERRPRAQRVTTTRKHGNASQQSSISAELSEILHNVLQSQFFEHKEQMASEFEVVHNALQLHTEHMERFVDDKLAALQKHISESIERLETTTKDGLEKATLQGVTLDAHQGAPVTDFSKKDRSPGHWSSKRKSCTDGQRRTVLFDDYVQSKNVSSSHLGESIDLSASQNTQSSSEAGAGSMKSMDNHRSSSHINLEHGYHPGPNLERSSSAKSSASKMGNRLHTVCSTTGLPRSRTYALESSEDPSCEGDVASGHAPSVVTVGSMAQPNGEWLEQEQERINAAKRAVTDGRFAGASGQGHKAIRGRTTLMSYAASRKGFRSFNKIFQMISNHPAFDSLISVTIVLNSLFIAYCTNWRIENDPNASPPDFFRACDLTFCGIFTTELCIRIMAERALFMYGANWKWNLMDTIIVLLAILEEILTFMMKFELESGSVTTIRLLRCIRLTRIVRGIRLMRFFRDLRLMVAGILHSMKSLAWCIVLLNFVMVIFAILVIEVVADDIHRAKDESGCDSSSCPDGEDPPPLLKYYGNMFNALYVLFKAITGGHDWGELADPLSQTHHVLVFCFCLYIAFQVLAVLNIVTGVFVENASSFAQADSENVILEDINERKALIEEVKSVFKAADKDGSGALDKYEFEELFNDPVVQAYFRKLQLDIKQSGANGLFHLMDFEGNGTIDIDTFVMSVASLRGTAKSLEIAKLRFDIKKIHERLRLVVKFLQDSAVTQERVTQSRSMGDGSQGYAAVASMGLFSHSSSIDKIRLQPGASSHLTRDFVINRSASR
eukprot:gnl/MRDRNA2_/MRDRNA2_18209_c0_seq1.p1 gnl/MRDRNA2_/MRDRNA2_18209_c0~~gnl/MRDRNA2_/MRDRNA2_18209_c0_seq1.p1  ORF type:complete len:849 (-),score=141.52 gnl/MRDRNA2_/MRDRNA2_18209_c0_seq1:111-2513(-)